MKNVTVRVAVDAMGGDRAPEEIVAGARAARDDGTVPVLFGPRELLRPLAPELEVIDASPIGPIHLTAVGPGLNLGRRDVASETGGAPIARIERAATVWIEDEMWAELEARRDRAAMPDVAAMTELVEAPHGRRLARPPAVIPIAPARRAAAAGRRPDVSRPRRVVAAGPGQDPDGSPAA